MSRRQWWRWFRDRADAAGDGWPAVVRLQQSWGTTSGQIEELLKKIAAELGVPDHGLRALSLLKAPPSLDKHVDKSWTV